jgi:hypothetical protein
VARAKRTSALVSESCFDTRATLSRLTREGAIGNVAQKQVEKSAASGTNCRSKTGFRKSERHHFISLFAMARCLLIGLKGLPFGVHAMLPAIGAASTALDAIQSLTSPQSTSSQSIDFGDVLPDAGDGSGALPSSSTVSGFSNAQISSDNLNALLDAQSLSSGDLASALDSGDSTSDPSQDQSGAASGTSAYTAINQLAQMTAIPLGLSISA